MDNKDVACIIRHWRNQRESLNKNLAAKMYPASIPQHLPDDTNEATFNLSAAPRELKRLFPEQQLEALCESLMDYICSGHFKIYRKLLQQRQSLAGDTAEVIKGIYYNIETSTDQALNFNDKYDCGGHFRIAENNSLAYDLDKLNRSLAIRFVLEEQLVEIGCN